MAKFGTTLSQADFWSDVPPQWWHLMAKSGTTSGQADIWSDIPSSRGILWPRMVLLHVRLTFGQI